MSEPSMFNKASQDEIAEIRRKLADIERLHGRLYAQQAAAKVLSDAYKDYAKAVLGDPVGLIGISVVTFKLDPCVNPDCPLFYHPLQVLHLTPSSFDLKDLGPTLEYVRRATLVAGKGMDQPKPEATHAAPTTKQ